MRRHSGDNDLTPQELTKALEAALDAPRHAWPTGLCRRLWDFLAEVADERRRSPSHLSRWYNLVGYCLRPGFGDPLDKFRVEQLWKMMAAPPRADAGKGARGTAPRLTETGADAWIMWRRVAGGLHSTLQQALYDRLRPVLLPAKGKVDRQARRQRTGRDVARRRRFERLEVKHKEALGSALLKPLRRSPVPTYGFWALTRSGRERSCTARSTPSCIIRSSRNGWRRILPFEPGNQSERLAWAFCLSQLARRTGQRALDIDDGHRENVLRVLRGLSIPGHWVRMVEEVSELEQEEQGQMLGDSLPIGLRLLQSQE